MPGYRKHLTVGAGVYLVGICVLHTYGHTYTLATSIEWLFCSLAGSLFPDIDVKSKGQQYFFGALFVALVILTACQKYVIASCLSIPACIPLLVRHRGIFHNPGFVVLLSTVLWLILRVYYPLHAHILWFDTVFFSAGALSHIWLDIGLRRMLRV